MKRPLLNRQKGFTLLEVLLAIGISLALGAAALTDLRRDNESKQAMAVGQQLETVGKALNTYLALHYSQIVALENVTGVGSSADPGPRTCTPNAGTSPFGGGTSSICTITTDTLVRSGLLPVSFSGRNAFGAQYNLYIRVTGTATPIVDGMVITDTPYTTGGGVRFDLLGQAMQVAGADSGMTRTTPTVLEGLNGTWRDEAWPAVQGLPGLDERGLLGYRSGYGSSGYAAYLRLDGTTPMTGALDMSGNNIENVATLESNTVLVKDQIRFNVDASDLNSSPDRTEMIAGAGTLEVRNNGGVTFRTLDGTGGARVNTGDIVAAGNLEVAGSTGTNGDITASRNMVIGQDLTVNRRVTIGNGLNVTAGGASIIGDAGVTGNLGVTNTASARDVVATNSVAVGTYQMTAAGLSSTASPANAWFYDNSVAAWRTTGGLQIDGAARVASLGVDGKATIGNSLQLTGSAPNESPGNPTVVAAGDSCVSTQSGTLRRTSTGEVAQCSVAPNGSWYWRSGLNITMPSTTYTTTTAYAPVDIDVACPAGATAISGGFRAFRGNPEANPNGIDTDQPSASAPYTNGGISGWRVRTSPTNARNTVYTVTAICVR